MPDFSPQTETTEAMPVNPSISDLIWRIVRVAVLVWLGLILFLGLSQRSMIYFPTKDNAASLQQNAVKQGLDPWINPEGEAIGYQRLPAPDDTRTPVTALIFHGNAGNALDRGYIARILREAMPERAVAIYILEYPGFGARPGEPSQDALLAAANDALKQIPSDTPLLLIGESIGTGVATGTAASHPDRVGGLLLLTPFDSLANVARYHYPLVPVWWLIRDKFPSDKWLTKYQGPCTFVIASNDEVIPAELGTKLYEKYDGPKKILTVQGAAHNDVTGLMSPAEWRAAMNFLLGR